MTRYSYLSLFQAVNESLFYVAESDAMLFTRNHAWCRVLSAPLELASQMLVLATWFTSLQFNGKQGDGVGLQYHLACAAPATVSS